MRIEAKDKTNPQRVFKYPLKTHMQLPFAAPIMKVDYQMSPFGRGPMLWILISESEVLTMRRFKTVATGEQAPFSSSYVGSYEDEQYLMWHIFELNTLSEEFNEKERP